MPRTELTRRELVAGGLSLAAAASLPGGGRAAEVRRLSHGGFDIAVLSDGFLTLPAEVLLPDARQDERAEILARLGGDAAGAPVQANIPLLRRGSEVILVDTGSGSHFQPSAGRLVANLRALGLTPEDVTAVLCTHAHPDHSGATTDAAGVPLFPRARYVAARAEWEFWTDSGFERRWPEALHGFARGARRDLLAVQDRLTLVEPGDEVLPGITAIGTPGHTPGHLSFEIADSTPLLVTGDACTSDVIFFEHPEWHFGFDTEPDRALHSRRQLLDRAATQQMLMLGYHWAYPGLGRAERRGAAYRFVPG